MYIEPSRAEMPKARQAWKGLRENYLRGEARVWYERLPTMDVLLTSLCPDLASLELDARYHYIEALRQGVIVPLLAYRDVQERMRKRIKEDLKTSIGRYDEMRNYTLPRARKNYEKKCDEVSTHRGGPL
jgi:hypothetical protein